MKILHIFCQVLSFKPRIRIRIQMLDLEPDSCIVNTKYQIK
jgi:hypothetical protein